MASKALTLRKKKVRKRNKVHGFLKRMSTTAGRKLVLGRRRKGRKNLTA